MTQAPTQTSHTAPDQSTLDISFEPLSHTPRVAVIGYGRWGRQCHSYLISLVPGLQLFGVASSDAAKRQQICNDWNCKAYESLDDAIADPEVDVIVLATPNNTHCDFSVRALEAGKHVVTDKVMCLSLEECERMAAAAQSNHRLLSVFQNRRRDGDFLTLQNAISDGTLGEVKWIEMAWQGMGMWGGWRGQLSAGGGRLYDLGAHLIDQLCLLFPQRVESVYCRLHRDFEDTDVESEALVVIGFEGGRTGIADLSSRAAISKPRFYAHGDKATFIKHGLDPQENAMIAGDIDSAREDPDTFARIKGPHIDQALPTLPGRWRDYYENLAEALTNGTTPLVTLSSARRTMTVLDAALQSARSGEVIRPNAPGAH
ncbi:MAG: scyllo-inositol 2-dehydrogenase [Abditibacteriota bacterium]|nr:scyllo-inositol 2-dehydrogenase [Abditibacteriota bacterium]